MTTYNFSAAPALCSEGYPAYCRDSFADYLRQPFDTQLVIDLSDATLIEAVGRMIEMKSRLSPAYGKHYSSLIHNLRRIEEDYSCTLMPWHVTDVFWCNFIPYLLGRGLALSSIKTVCSQLRTAVEWAARHRARVSSTYDMVKIPSYCHQQIALTPDDVSHIFHYPVRIIPRRSQYIRNMERVRDMFVLSCNLGQRFSDMVRIDRTCFDRNMFTILQQKMGTYARVDIERMAIDRNTTYHILEKYGYRAPVTGDISAYDRYIKQLLRYIGFNEEVKRETKVNGHVEAEFCPRWKLVSSHTARRTFATVNVLRGIRTTEVRRATGHRSESSFEKYLCYFDD